MTTGTFARTALDSPQAALAAALATPLVIAGIPLIESIRTCRVQTAGGPPGYGRAPMGRISASDHLWTDRDRDIVTPANDLLYFCAWINLAGAPAILSAPATTGRYFVMELLDAWTENFINLGTRNVPATGASFALAGPSTSGPLPVGTTRVDCPTDLVWLIGRVLVTGEDDLAAARAFMQGFRLASPVTALPACVRAWQEGGDPALDFFANLMRAAHEYPAPAIDGKPGFDAHALWRALGFDPADPDSLARANSRIHAGLKAAYADGMAVVEAHTKSQGRKPWGYTTRLGKWRGNLLLRATTALKGLGALAAEETIYAMADFDRDGEGLDGAHDYVLRFAPGALPPADAFWSVSLYGEDRYFVVNPIGRFALGDRTLGLTFDADGSLSIPIQHARPTQHAKNWLPAPAGRFYLILRLYHPREEFLSGRYTIPPVARVKVAA